MRRVLVVVGVLSLVAAGLISSVGAQTSYFESRVSLSDPEVALTSAALGLDGTIVAGAYSEMESTGAAFILSPTGDGGYSETALVAPEGEPYDRFGSAVDITSDGRVVVGAHWDVVDELDAGSVYVFAPDGSFISRLVQAEPQQGGYFGDSVVAGPDGSFVVTAPGVFVFPFELAPVESVHVFEPNGPAQYTETVLTASDGDPTDSFGREIAVGIDGTIVVGATNHDGPNGEQGMGAVYVYKPDGAGGYAETIITLADGSAGDFFGSSVAIESDGTILAGAFGSDVNGEGSGALYTFTPDASGNYIESNFPISNPAGLLDLGSSLAIGPDGAVYVGAQLDNGLGGGGIAFITILVPDGLGGYTESRLTATSGGSLGGVIPGAVDGTLVGGIGRGVVLLYNPTLASVCRNRLVTVDLGAGELPTEGDDVILGTPGDDIIAAGGGNDVVCGGDGDDKIWGQAGDDTIYGDDGADRVRGGPGADEVWGGDGADDLAGSSGDDIVLGEFGEDKIRGGTGDDALLGGEDNDVLVSGNGGEDHVSGGLGEDKVVGGPRPDSVNGGPGDDLLKGNGGADRLWGNSGDDELFGGPQPDTLHGGEGTDMCNGGTTGSGAPESDTTNFCESEVNIP